MKFTELFIGALTLRQQTFVTLRERSDVFQRGFMVLLIAALVAGAFASLEGAIRVVTPLMSKEQVVQIANDAFERNYNGPPAFKAMFQPYPAEIASMIYDLENLPPRAGEGARPVVAILEYVGNVLATPFSWRWAGWMLFAGLLFQLAARWLGGRASMAQMLGLSALAAAPQIFSALTSLLNLLATVGNSPILSSINGLFGFVIAIWSAAVYVKATSVAQNFSLARSIGAVALGLAILIIVFLALVIVLGVVIGGFVGAVSR